jgi:Spy/CpxP family protein refolding chaperone
MTRYVWGLLSLALLCVAGSYADDKQDEQRRQPGRRPGGERPGASAFLQFQRGGQLLSDKEMEELKLDDKQKEKVSKLLKDYETSQKESREAVQKAFQDLRGGDATKLREAMQKAREAGTKAREDAESKLTAVLNDDQKKKFADLKKARQDRGFRGFQQGAFGRGGPFTPGQILPPGTRDRLELNDEQKKKVEELEKKVKDELTKILTEEQRKKLEEGGRRGRPRPDQN